MLCLTLKALLKALHAKALETVGLKKEDVTFVQFGTVG
jgi:hypothetical protein